MAIEKKTRRPTFNARETELKPDFSAAPNTPGLKLYCTKDRWIDDFPELEFATKCKSVHRIGYVYKKSEQPIPAEYILTVDDSVAYLDYGISKNAMEVKRANTRPSAQDCTMMAIRAKGYEFALPQA